MAFAKRYAEQMTDEESKSLDLLIFMRTKITTGSPHHRTLLPVCGASPKEKPKLAVTVRATKASLSRLRENEGGGPKRGPQLMQGIVWGSRGGGRSFLPFLQLFYR